MWLAQRGSFTARPHLLRRAAAVSQGPVTELGIGRPGGSQPERAAQRVRTFLANQYLRTIWDRREHRQHHAVARHPFDFNLLTYLHRLRLRTEMGQEAKPLGQINKSNYVGHV